MEKIELSEVSPYLNYFNRLFGKGTSTPAPGSASPAPIPFPGGAKATPGAGVKYVQELDKVLQSSQMKLSEFVNSLGTSLRIIKKNMGIIDFTKLKNSTGLSQLKPSVVSTKPVSGFDFKKDAPTIKTSKRKANLPINPIFENVVVNWKENGDKLAELMNNSYQSVSNVLQTIAKDSGYTPKGTNIKSLVSDLQNFRVLDKESALKIRKKLMGFISAYKQLETWLALFRRTEVSMKNSKKAS